MRIAGIAVIWPVYCGGRVPSPAMRDSGLTNLRDTNFFVRPVNLFECLADFAHGSVGSDAVNDERHGVRVTDAAIGADDWLLGGCLLQRVEGAADIVIVAASAEGFQFFRLMVGN